MLKTLKVGETIRHKPSYEPWLVIRVFEVGWLVVDLLSADDPAVPKVILPRYFDNWIRDIDTSEKKIMESTEERFEKRLEQQWNFL